MTCPGRSSHQPLPDTHPGTPLLPRTGGPRFLLHGSGLSFALGSTSQLKVGPHGGTEPKECPGRLAVSKQSSRVLPASRFGEPCRQARMSDGCLRVRQERRLITEMAADEVLWHRRKSVSLACSIVKNLYLKLLTFGDYSRSVSN